MEVIVIGKNIIEKLQEIFVYIKWGFRAAISRGGKGGGGRGPNDPNKPLIKPEREHTLTYTKNYYTTEEVKKNLVMLQLMKINSELRDEQILWRNGLSQREVKVYFADKFKGNFKDIAYMRRIGLENNDNVINGHWTYSDIDSVNIIVFLRNNYLFNNNNNFFDNLFREYFFARNRFLNDFSEHRNNFDNMTNNEVLEFLINNNYLDASYREQFRLVFENIDIITPVESFTSMPTSNIRVLESLNFFRYPYIINHPRISLSNNVGYFEDYSTNSLIRSSLYMRNFGEIRGRAYEIDMEVLGSNEGNFFENLLTFNNNLITSDTGTITMDWVLLNRVLNEDSFVIYEERSSEYESLINESKNNIDPNNNNVDK